MTPRWGRAGQRLTEAEARARDGKRRLDAWKAERSAEREEKRGHAEWAEGLLSPERITLALNAKGLDGAEVDAQCLAEEPEVDLWEAGTLYPTWEQVKALAALCGVTPRFLMQGDGGTKIRPQDTTLRFHADLSDLSPTVERFTSEAVRARLSPAPSAPVVELHPATLW